MVEAQRVAEFEWELPIGYVDAMRVPGRVFASANLFERALKDRAAEQVANVATLPGIVGASLAMPDLHWGYGFPIGGVAATDPGSEGSSLPEVWASTSVVGFVWFAPTSAAPTSSSRYRASSPHSIDTSRAALAVPAASS